MEYRKLGRSGLKVSALSFGSWVTFGNQLDEDPGPAGAWLRHTKQASILSTMPKSYAHGRGVSENCYGKVLKKLAWRPRKLSCFHEILLGIARRSQ